MIWASAAGDGTKPPGQMPAEEIGVLIYTAEPSLDVDVAVHAASMRTRNRDGIFINYGLDKPHICLY